MSHTCTHTHSETSDPCQDNYSRISMADTRCVILFSLLDELYEQTDGKPTTHPTPTSPTLEAGKGKPSTQGQMDTPPLVGYFLQVRCYPKCSIRCHCFSPDQYSVRVSRTEDATVAATWRGLSQDTGEGVAYLR